MNKKQKIVCNYTLISMFVGVLLSCNYNVLQEQTIKVSFSHAVPLHRSQSFRKVYYPDGEGGVATKSVDSGENSINLVVKKKNVTPIMSCIHFYFTENSKFFPDDTLVTVLGKGSAFCPFGEGGTYPLDTKKVYTLNTKEGNSFQLAQKLLVLHTRGFRIEMLNVAKLKNKMDSEDNNFFLLWEKMVQDIVQNKLSTYSIKSETIVNIVENRWKHTEWGEVLDNWVFVSFYPFRKVPNQIILPQGTWLFVHPTEQRYAYVALSSQKVFFSPFYGPQKR